MRPVLSVFASFAFAGGASIAPGAEPQNPSPMVEHTREHPRLEKRSPEGERWKLEMGTLFVPGARKADAEVPLLVFFHGGDWIPEVAAEKQGCAVLRVQQAGNYAAPFREAGRFSAWLDGAAATAGKKWSHVTVGGWSAGCAALRELMKHPADADRVEAALFIDGIHTSYTAGKPGPVESSLDTKALEPVATWCRAALAGKKRALILHTEIFPGTFASTTETADWLLRELGVQRRAVLEWGPMKTQQLSTAEEGGFTLLGFAGNSAPDHVDLLHALPDWLERLAKASR